MSIHAICNGCGRKIKEYEPCNQIFIRDLNNSEQTEKHIILCQNCTPAILSDAIDTETTYTQKTEIPKDLIGLTLREFLNTDYYLQNNQLCFCDKYKQPIDEFLKCLDYKITKISTPDKTEIQWVILQE